MPAVTVSRSNDQLIAVKELSAELAAKADHEAEVLDRIDHPGVVRLVGLEHTSDGGRVLQTLFVSSDTWASRPLGEPGERVEAIAALAGVIADLHDMGMAHCQLNASHVLHGERDRPVLCGFSAAGDASDENRRADLEALAHLACGESRSSRGAVGERLVAIAGELRAGEIGARDVALRLDQTLNARTARSVAAQLVRSKRKTRLRELRPARLFGQRRNMSKPDTETRNLPKRDLPKRNLPKRNLPKRNLLVGGVGVMGFLFATVLVLGNGVDAGDGIGGVGDVCHPSNASQTDVSLASNTQAVS